MADGASSLACPVRCGRSRRSGHLMCPPCWSRVSDGTQRAVMRTWRAYRRAVRYFDPEQAGRRLELDSARPAYLEAREQAIREAEA